MFAVGCLGGVGKGSHDGTAFVPLSELGGVVAAAELAALAARDEHKGIVPAARAGDEAHGRAMTEGGGARAECGSTLWFAGDAEKPFQPAVAAERMEHL